MVRAGAVHAMQQALVGMHEHGAYVGMSQVDAIWKQTFGRRACSVVPCPDRVLAHAQDTACRMAVAIVHMVRMMCSQPL
eukprot:2755890-Prymnesium_polylepis.1